MSPVSVSGERLMFTQSDMDDSNFGVDEHGRMVFDGFQRDRAVARNLRSLYAVFGRQTRPHRRLLGLVG
jgi:hypothetical protein